MSIFILNEKEYVEKCLQDGKMMDKPGRTLALMAQYYYQYCGYRKLKITELLIEFLQKNYPLYSRNAKLWDKTCERIARKTGGNKLLELNGVAVSQAELDIIRNINNKVLERLAFTMLCIAKLNNAKKPSNNSWINTDYKSVFDSACVNGNNQKRKLILHDLVNRGLLEMPQKHNNTNLRVTFLNEDSEQALFVSDFRKLGYVYQQHCGDVIFKCTKCGVLFRPDRYTDDGICKVCATNRNVKMRKSKCIDCGKEFQVDAKGVNKCRCDDCQKIKTREATRKRVQRFRNKEIV